MKNEPYLEMRDGTWSWRMEEPRVLVLRQRREGVSPCEWHMVRELLRPVFPSCSSLMTLSVELVTRSPDTRHSMLGEGFPRLSQEQLISSAVLLQLPEPEI